MGAGSAAIGSVLDRYRDLLERMDEVARAVSPSGSPDACGGCRACCGPLSLLPLEACALLMSGALLDDAAPSGAACPVRDGDGGRAPAHRPFACRARGLPARQLSAEGDMVVGSCERAAAGLPGGNGRARNGRRPVAPIDEWASELCRLDREFRGGTGIAPERIALVDLWRAPERYRALSDAGGLALASRSAR